MYRLYQRFLAFFRLDLQAVCKESGNERDYHDYPDAIGPKQPLHWHAYTCERCGAKFMI